MRTKCDRCDAVVAHQEKLIKENLELSEIAKGSSALIQIQREKIDFLTINLHELIQAYDNYFTKAADGEWKAGWTEFENIIDKIKSKNGDL